MKTSIRFGNRLACVLFCVIVLLAATSVTALAAPGGHGRGHGNAYGSGANAEYQQAVAYFAQWNQDAAELGIAIKPNELNKLAKLYGQRSADKENFIVYLTDWTNEKIERQVERAQRSRCNDVALLLIQVDFLVDNVMYWADVTDYEVVCVYEPYEVDGQTVLIDPLRVVNRRR